MQRSAPSQHGFSLVELAVVLVIVALLTGGLMLGLAAQRETVTNQEAQRQLDNAKEALLGFTITNGRLPCPANPALANGVVGAGLEDCAILPSGHGVLPWATLGLPETDPWGQRLTYFASTKFTTVLVAGSLSSFTMATGVAPDNAGTANVKITETAGSNIASDLAAVVISHGARGVGSYTTAGTMIGGAAGDEAENADADLTFVAHTPTPDFDDLLTWITPALLKSRLVAVGKLP
ncbi:MAG: type II secretion system protein [Azonexus sp.]|nr:type II secretion system protein [Azonexus sp.]